MNSNTGQHITEIINILKDRYGDAKCSLDFKNPFQLLVATILAAQSTDKNVNKVTPSLFAKYPSPAAFANADIEELQQDVYSTGFYKQKARSIIEASQDIVNEHNGQVPDSMEELVKLRGVGRKTANVVLGCAYGKPSMIVDTHMLRVSGRLGLVDSNLAVTKDAVKVEQALMKIIPQEHWTLFSHLIVFFGRDICTAKNPQHSICPLLHICPTGQAEMQR
ncbi:MAG: endonuclease III [Armatimonadota bacterium]